MSAKELVKDKIFEVMILGFTLVLGIQVYTLTIVHGLAHDVQDIDRRVARIEGAFWCKDHALAKEETR